MIGLLITLAGAYGVFLLYTALVLDWHGFGVGPDVSSKAAPRRRAEHWLVQAGLDDVRSSEFLAVIGVVFLAAAGLAFALFGSPLPALLIGGFAATWPIAAYRGRRQRNREKANEAWPRMIEEIGLLTGALGRSIPQALFEVGRSSPTEMQPAFAAAQREWSVSTDFNRTISILKTRLADATADAACETLLVAHEVGGTDLERRLSALADDRLAHLHGRKDALAKQAAARFSRRFVLFVPFGMALAGLSIGDGRAAYETPTGQLGVILAVAMVIACWLWSGRILKLPDEQRVFFE